MNNDLPERLSQDYSGAQAGGDKRNAEVANWLRSRSGANVQEPEGILKSAHGLVGAENLAAEQFAIENDCWIGDPYSLGMIGPNGDENECFVSPDGTRIFKVNLLTHTGGSILRLFERIIFHNAIFPETRYDFVGFTNMGFARSAYPVFCQTFVKDVIRASIEEIADHMRALGFKEEPSKTGGWSNSNLLVWDVLPKNALKDSAGNIYVIDAEIEPL